jgi:hypothetical protein
VAVEVSTAVEDSTVVLRTLPAAALEAASVEAALDPRSRLVLSLAQYSARHPVTMAAVTGQVTTTTHMPTITGTAVVTITVMPPKMASSASQEQFSVARTVADTSASNEFKKRPIGRFFLGSTEVIQRDVEVHTLRKHLIMLASIFTVASPITLWVFFETTKPKRPPEGRPLVFRDC